ncbi:MAG: hypothetical protein WA668_00345 [Candidatus Cybelea sp.]
MRRSSGRIVVAHLSPPRIDKDRVYIAFAPSEQPNGLLSAWRAGRVSALGFRMIFVLAQHVTVAFAGFMVREPCGADTA